jgi:hypothetical protein
MSDNGNHLTEEQIFQDLSSPDKSAPTSLDVSREGSPIPHLKDENGNDPSDRLAGLGEGQQVAVDEEGEVKEDGDKEEEEEHSTPRRRKVGSVRSTEVSSGQGVDHGGEDSDAGGAEEEAEKKDEDGSSKQSRSAMRGGRDRPALMNVRWGSSLRDKKPVDDEVSKGLTSESKRAARRLVRQHTGRPPVPPPSSDDEDTNASGSAISLTSTASQQPRSTDRRRSSGDYSTQSSGEDDIPVTKGRGVLSELLSLYQRDRKEKDRGVVKSLIGSSDEIRRRRWSEKSLYDVESRRGSVNSVVSGASSEGGGDTDYSGDRHRVRRNRRKQHLPHRSQNLDEPYIPAPKTSHPISPSTNVTFLQRAYDFFGHYGGPATWFGSPAAHNQERRGGKGDYRNIVALVITTSALAGPASPALSRLAPAAGQGAETSSGARKLSYYENAHEKIDRRRADEELDEDQFGVPQDSADLGKVMEEGRVNQHKLRPGRKRGKRRQREMAVTKHIANIVERKQQV